MLVFSLQNRGDNRTFLKVVKIEQVATCKVFRRVSDTQEVLNQFNYDFNYKFFIYSCKQQTFIEYLLCGPRACANTHTHTHKTHGAPLPRGVRYRSSRGSEGSGELLV